MFGLPRDRYGSSIQLTPAHAAKAVTVDDTISSATSVTLNAATTIIEVNAIGAGVYLRYQADVSNSAFDEYILANTVRQYVVPSGVTVVSVIQDTSGGKVRIIEK